MNDSVTVVITSCGRLDLLDRTIQSFIAYNTYPIEKYIIIDDSANEEVFAELKKLNEKFNNIFELLLNHDKLGQVRSVDKAYALVDTDYIFHCEDDWEFYKADFIQKSIDVLKEDAKIITALIRPKSDSLNIGISSEVLQTKGGIKYRKTELATYLVDPKINRWVRNYGGFTLNPTLKRVEDYKLISSYTSVSNADGCEEPVDKFYQNLGYYVVSLSEHNDDGYVRHIGWNKTTENHKW